MLMKCPECELQVSDKALICPHCGYPLKKESVTIPHKRKSKHKRLPNGFGQITLIKKPKLYKPYRASVTVGKTPEGKSIVKLLKPQAYFETYNDAYAALVEHNKNPYDLDDNITMSELFEKWFEEYKKTLKSDSASRTILSAWSYCTPIKNMEVQVVRARHLKGCINDAYKIENEVKVEASSGTKSRMKSVFNLMFDYANEHDIVDKNYARTFKLSDDIVFDIEKSKVQHIDFTQSEITQLWASFEKVAYVDIILFQCYSGLRPQELGLLECDNVNLEKGIIIGGMKTPAGKNRAIPIHPRVREIVERHYNRAKELDSKYLFNCEDTTTHRNSLKLTYDKYSTRFHKVMQVLNLNPEHRPHDPRVHFVTQAKKYKVDEYAIKYIVGHKIDDITEAIYTKRKDPWLIEEIQKIK